MKSEPSAPGLIRVEQPKGCYLLLTWQEYVRGLKRPKAARRWESNEVTGQGRRQCPGGPGGGRR